MATLGVELLENLFDHMPIGIILLDPDGTIRRFNRYEEQLSGKRRDDVIGRSFFDDVAPCTRDIALEDRFREGVARNKLDLDLEFRFPYPFNRVPREVRIRAVSIPGSVAAAHVLLVEDITARRNLERRSQDLLVNVRALLERYVGTEYAHALEAAPGGTLIAADEDAYVLFADIVGFSRFAKDITPAELFERLNQVMGDAIAIVHRHGGVVDKVLGDGLLAWFRPQVTKERALWDALRAAWDIRRFARPGLTFRVGVAYGPVTLGTLGSPEYGNVTLLGHAVNVARRLQEAAPAGEVVLDAHLVEAAGDAIDVTAMPGVTLKNIADSVTVYRLDALHLP